VIYFDITLEPFMSQTPEINFGSEHNSSLRGLVDGALAKMVDPLVEKFPKITPNQITLLGTTITAIALELELVAAAFPQKEQVRINRLALILYPLGQSLDKLDGVVARSKANQGFAHDANNGELVDTLADRLTELLVSMHHARSADRRDDVMGMAAGLLSAATNNFSSLTRADAARRGKEVPETGSNPLQFFGTRVGRSFTGGAGSFFEEVTINFRGKEHQIPLQTILDSISALGTITTALARHKIANNAKHPVTLSQKQQEKAAQRFQLLKITAGLSVLIPVAYGVFALLKKRK
jgi:phosphatidylglycerophosphate synthase